MSSPGESARRPFGSDIGSVCIANVFPLVAKAAIFAAETAFPAAAITVLDAPDLLQVPRSADADLWIAGAHQPENLSRDGFWRLLRRVASVPHLVLPARCDARSLRALQEAGILSLFDPVHGTDRDLPAALETVAEGRRYISPTLQQRLRESSWPRPEALLTPMEQVVLSIIGAGLKDSEAASRLRLSPAAIRSHRFRIMSKLGAHNRGELFSKASLHGYIMQTEFGELRPGLIPPARDP